MTVHALLQPPGPAADGLDPADGRALWSVRLTGWQPAWGAIPGGMRVEPVGSAPHLVGGLSLNELEQWHRRLRADHHPAPADALAQAIGNHLAPAPTRRWSNGRRTWTLDGARSLVMGIVNVTPDSFSGDGLHRDAAAAIAQGLRMAAAGADILDIGGESTRPGAEPVGEQEELDRVIPVIAGLAGRVALPLAVDTSKPAVMRAALAAGAAMINDVAALEQVTDAGFLTQPPCADAPVVLMHKRGTPKTMQERPDYRHVLAEVHAYLADRIAWCERHGIARARLIVDPGIGFGKSTAHNLALLRGLRVFRGLGTPLLLGVSRKRLLGALTGETEALRRDAASHVLAALAALTGGVHIFRVHDVAGARQALAVAHGWRHGAAFQDDPHHSNPHHSNPHHSNPHHSMAAA